MKSRMHHIHVVSENPAVSAAFYQEFFGAAIFTPEMEYMGSLYVSVQLGEAEIRIRGVRPNDPAKTSPPGRGLHHFGIQVDNLDEVCGKLERAGVQFTKKPGPGVLGSRTAFIKDPDGALIELVEEPAESD